MQLKSHTPTLKYMTKNSISFFLLGVIVVKWVIINLYLINEVVVKRVVPCITPCSTECSKLHTMDSIPINTWQSFVGAQTWRCTNHTKRPFTYMPLPKFSNKDIIGL